MIRAEIRQGDKNVWQHVGLGDLQNMSFPTWLSQNAWTLLAGIGCYVFIGIAWATFRWWLLVRQMRDAYERSKAEWLARMFALTLFSSSDAQLRFTRFLKKIEAESRSAFCSGVAEAAAVQWC